ncbi:hypothetical protein EX30DRAFT_367439 [Ascodesmis nigricans]|uniref:Uncharacterized protein n=1 Tax=Ascodesmis nigricans TaxID=341454 RepID=A0A4S2MHN9_9PEZI|nr:hypothetical protein EX30DRAFT_367439 [Ascodesmis nigricans]
MISPEYPLKPETGSPTIETLPHPHLIQRLTRPAPPHALAIDISRRMRIPAVSIPAGRFRDGTGEEAVPAERALVEHQEMRDREGVSAEVVGGWRGGGGVFVALGGAVSLVAVVGRHDGNFSTIDVRKNVAGFVFFVIKKMGSREIRASSGSERVLLARDTEIVGWVSRCVL